MSHGHHHSPLRLENPQRLLELNPLETLQNLGFKAGQVLCDIGAGTGIFAWPACELSNMAHYALEQDPQCIELLNTRKQERHITNLHVVQVTDDLLPIKDAVSDMTMMVTVLHEIAQPELLFKEIARITKPEGQLVIIEFHGYQTPMGPLLDHRLAQETTIAMVTKFGWVVNYQVNLGENFYCVKFNR